MNILTLTLSPAFDLHCTAEKFSAEHENLLTIESRQAGGKGINISRALSSVNIKSTALTVLGKENSDEFLKLINKDDIDLCPVIIDGRIRENITVHPISGTETRISFKGFDCGDGLLDIIEEKLDAMLVPCDILTFTGRMPEGVTVGRAEEMIRNMNKKGVKTVIDSRSFSLDNMISCNPFLIKPNEEEISIYLKKEISSLNVAVPYAEKLHESGIENVCITLGGKGAVFAGSEGSFIAESPKVNVISTVGAGDSFIAGFLSAIYDNEPPAECFKTAMAFGTAACETEGTVPPALEEILRLKEMIKIQKSGPPAKPEA